MITSAANRGWLSDVLISDRIMAGLPVPSLVRTAKVAIFERRDAQKVGTILAAPSRVSVDLYHFSLIATHSSRPAMTGGYESQLPSIVITSEAPHRFAQLELLRFCS
jgi:hypothetical protein